MDLLTNAIESIQVGVEDYQSGTRPRLLSAVRNIHAGILLLFKEALRRESPKDSNDVLMMAKIVPLRDARGIVFVGNGKKTVDAQQIKERFEAVGITTDWKRFERINDARNDVEHRHPHVDQKSLHSLISDSFLIIQEFIQRELQDDPLSLLGEETWQAMLEVAEVYRKEKQECDRLLAAAKWTSPTVRSGVSELTCSVCGSNLLKPMEDSFNEIILTCGSCGEEESPESYVPKAIKSALRGEAYIAMTDGGEPPYVSCPECGEETYLMEEDRCALCQSRVEHVCSVCGNEIPAEELDSSPVCGYCNHMMNKDD